MPSNRIEFHDSVYKSIQKLDRRQQKRILSKIYELPNGDVKALKGKNGEYRLRVGDWRIIWEYRRDVIFIMEIGARGDVYK